MTAAGEPAESTEPAASPQAGPSDDHRGLVVGHDGRRRCWWAGDDALNGAYHDHEWGVRTRDDWDEHELFGLLVLETFQAGLSWLTILRKRGGFAAAFAGFDPHVIARWGDAQRDRLLADRGIVRNRAKVAATFANARATVALHDRDQRLVDVVFDAAPEPAPARPRRPGDVASTTSESEQLARRLKQLGFAFVGPTVAYALMQSAGVVDDHLVGCHVVTGAGQRF